MNVRGKLSGRFKQMRQHHPKVRRKPYTEVVPQESISVPTGRYACMVNGCMVEAFTDFNVALDYAASNLPCDVVDRGPPFEFVTAFSRKF